MPLAAPVGLCAERGEGAVKLINARTKPAEKRMNPRRKRQLKNADRELEYFFMKVECDVGMR